MLKENDLKDDQIDLIAHLYESDHTLVDASMGGGKTVCSMTAASDLLEDSHINRVLVLAPLTVAKTVWREEGQNWEHLTHLRINKAIGSPKQRMAAFTDPSDIVVMNFDNMVWLFKENKQLLVGFDALIIDELSKLGEVGGKGFKALRPHIKNFKWRVGLTGTPVSEDWVKLFGQMLIIDQGKRLGTRKDMYLRRFFYPTDYNEYNWELHDWAPQAIGDLISDVVYKMPDYRHELEQPIYETVELFLPPDLRATYEEMKHDMVTYIDGEEITAENSAVLVGKLAQLNCGFLYVGDEDIGEEAEIIDLDGFRADALMEELAKTDTPVVVLYTFQADLNLLLDMMPDAVHMNSKNAENISERWNKGEIDVLLMHPKSGGHGLNLAKGGHEIIWYSPVWSRDLYEQTNARLWRRGQTERVRIRELVAIDTVDEIMRERVESKKEFEALWEKYLGG